MRARLRCERGQAATELLGMLPWLLLSIMLIWQGLLAGWAYTQASNAARTASRVHARSTLADPEKAARNAVSRPLRRGMRFELRGDRATVQLRIPILVPGISTDRLRAKRSAELPS